MPQLVDWTNENIVVMLAIAIAIGVSQVIYLVCHLQSRIVVLYLSVDIRDSVSHLFTTKSIYFSIFLGLIENSTMTADLVIGYYKLHNPAANKVLKEDICRYSLFDSHLFCALMAFDDCS